MDYREIGVVAVLILFSGLAFTVLKWPQGKHLTYSQHVAISKYSILYYVFLFSIFLPLVVVFFLGWFMPTFRLPNVFGVLVILSALTQFACTLIPETGGQKTRQHRLLAATSALFLLPLLLILLTQGTIPTIGKAVTLLSALSMIMTICVLVARRGEHDYMLILQTGYFVAFFVPILFITYL